MASYFLTEKFLVMKEEFQFSEIVQLIRKSRAEGYKAINVELINCYWQVGAYISKRIADTSWGDNTVKDLAKFIEKGHPDLKGYDRTGLYRMKKFYEKSFISAYVSVKIIAKENSTGKYPAAPSSGSYSEINNSPQH
jgi:hypothetical protein